MKKVLLSALVAIGSMLMLGSCDSNFSEVESSVVSQQALENEMILSARTKTKPSQELKFLVGHEYKKWQVTTYLINGVDYTNILFSECALDNIQIFSRHGNYVEIEGATKCNETDPAEFDSGTFTFSDNYTKWTLVSTHLNTIFDVLELTPVSFKITYADPAFGQVEIWLEAYHEPFHHKRHKQTLNHHLKGYHAPFFGRVK